MSTLPDRARVVIVGGGVIGASIAYHLARRGWTDVVLVERHELTSGTTWHAAGLVAQQRPTDATRRFVSRGLEVFRSLEEETGYSTGYHETGMIHLAMTPERMTELRIMASAVRSSGIEVEVLGPDEVLAKHPLLHPDGIVGGTWFPRDGRGSSSDTTMSLARGATQLGAQVHERTTALEVLRRGDRVTGIVTDRGRIDADVVVNATGMWAREFGRMAGVEVPLQALSHYYIVTEAIEGLQRNLPTIKSGDDYSYVKDEAGALMVGFFEPGGYPWASRGIPDGAAFTRLPEDWDHLGPFYERMLERMPILQDARIRLHFCGPESFTPDGLCHLGPAPGLANYYVAAGFNSTGFLSGPGAGAYLADLVVDGRSSIDAPELSPARVQRHETNRRFLEQRIPEVLDTAYDVHWPFEQRRTARGLRRSPLHDRVAAAGAVFGEQLGWERPNWYAPPGARIAPQRSFGRQEWFEYSAAEHAAVREGVGLFDTSSFGKLLVQGRDALKVLQRVSANDVDRPVGSVVYTQWLNEFGGIEADVTVTRTGAREFLVLSGPATVRRDHAWLARHIGEDHATVADVSGAYAMLSVMGPRSRDLLAPLTDADLSTAAFGFATSREIDLGLGFARANRLTYVGELGWELLIPVDLCAHVFDMVKEQGAGLGLRHAGYFALNSLRLEKGYRSWGHDISGNDTPLEAGLGFAVAWDKPGGFIGREALERQRAGGVRRRLVQFLADEGAVHAHHDAPILRDGRHVGKVASVQYGHTLGAMVALGWVQAPDVAPRDWFETGGYEFEVATERIPAKASLRPFYDPASERVRG